MSGGLRFFRAFTEFPVFFIVRKPVALAHVLMREIDSFIGFILTYIVTPWSQPFFIDRAYQKPRALIAGRIRRHIRGAGPSNNDRFSALKQDRLTAEADHCRLDVQLRAVYRNGIGFLTFRGNAADGIANRQLAAVQIYVSQ